MATDLGLLLADGYVVALGSYAPALLRPAAPSLQAVAGNDDDASCSANPKASRLSTSLSGGVTYYIVIDGFAGDWLASPWPCTIEAAMSSPRVGSTAPSWRILLMTRRAIRRST